MKEVITRAAAAAIRTAVSEAASPTMGRTLSRRVSTASTEALSAGARSASGVLRHSGSGSSGNLLVQIESGTLNVGKLGMRRSTSGLSTLVPEGETTAVVTLEAAVQSRVVTDGIAAMRKAADKAFAELGALKKSLGLENLTFSDVAIAKEFLPEVKLALKEALPKEVSLADVIKARDAMPEIEAAFAKIAKGHKVSVADAVHMSIMKEGAAQTGIKKTWEKVAEEFQKEFMKAAETKGSSGTILNKLWGHKGKIAAAGLGLTAFGSEFEEAAGTLAKEVTLTTAMEAMGLIALAVKRFGPGFSSMVADELARLQSEVPADAIARQEELEAQIKQQLLATQGANLGVTLDAASQKEVDEAASKIAAEVKAPENAGRTAEAVLILAKAMEPIYTEAIEQHRQRHEAGEAGGVIPTLDRATRYATKLLTKMSPKAPEESDMGASHETTKGAAPLSELVQQAREALLLLNSVTQAVMDAENAKKVITSAATKATQTVEGAMASLGENSQAKQAATTIARIISSMASGYEQQLGRDTDVAVDPRQLGSLEKVVTPGMQPNAGAIVSK
jgi:hypothetical protein